MKNTKIIKKYFSLVVLTVFLLVPLLPTAVVAGPQDSESECLAAGGQWGVVSPEVNPPIYGCTGLGPPPGGTPPDLGVDCTGNSPGCCNGVRVSVDVGCTESDSPILGYLGGIINFLMGGVLLVVTAMIIVGGIQYITAGGVPQKLEAARKRIINAVIALVTFLFLYGILQWLIPGGII